MIKDEETRKNYMRTKNKHTVKFRLDAEENTLLEEMMRKEGWGNMSGFIRNRMFGDDPEDEFKKVIKNGDKDTIVTALKNHLMELADIQIYLKSRYDKDMSVLYQEEGVDLKAWIGKTNRWHHALIEKQDETLRLVRMIAEAVGVDDKIRIKTEMHGDVSKMPKEEQDRLAEQLRREMIANGYGDILNN